jgi:parallel beta-helix repeat protein
MRRALFVLGLMVGCGANGATGTAGPTGPAGPPGEPGPAGADGGPGATPPPAAIDGLVDVKTLGATGDGTTDDTPALAAAAAAHDALFFPSGIYLVDELGLRPSTYVLAAPGAILRGKSGAGTGNVLTLSRGDRVDGLEVDGNKANRPSGASCIWAHDAPDVLLHAVYAHDCKTAGTSFGSSDDFVVEASRFERCDAQCLDLSFSSRGRVDGNSVDTCAHGIQWWGGDSATTSATGMFDLTITGNVVKHVTGGCIWGSDGERVTVSGNSVESCGDVGIDLEGTTHSTVTGNTVKNATNAGIATFYGSSNVTIESNTIDQVDAGGPGIKFFGTKPSRTLVVTGNTIQTSGSIGVTMDQGIAIDLSIENNAIVVTQAQPAIRALDAENVIITGNRLTVGGPTGISFEGPSASLITGNVVHTTADATTTPGDHAGIFLPWRSAAFPTQRNTVRDNLVSGFSTSINDDCWGDVASANEISFNRVDGAIYRRAGAGWTGSVSSNHRLSDPNAVVDALTY